MQSFDNRRLLLNDFNRFASTVSHSRGKCVGEQTWSCTLLQNFDGFLRCCNVTASRAAKCFTQRSGDDIHFTKQVKVLWCATACFAQNTNTMRIIHDQKCIVSFAQLNDLGQVNDVTFHAKDAVCDHPAAFFCRRSFQFRFQIFEIIVLVDLLFNFF